MAAGYLKPIKFRLKVICRTRGNHGVLAGTARTGHRRRTRHRPRHRGRVDGGGRAGHRGRAQREAARRRPRRRATPRAGSSPTSPQPEADDRQSAGGRDGARAGRHPGRQRRHRRIARRSSKTTPEQFRSMFELNVMGVVHADAGGARRHDRAQVRPHRRDRLDRRPEGLRLRLGLLRGEARRGRAGALAGARDREDRRHRQRRLPRLHRHRHDARKRVAHRRQDRPHAAKRRRPPFSRTIRWGGLSNRRRSPPPCSICARRTPPPSPGPRWWSPAESYDGRPDDDPARRGDQGLGAPRRPQDRVAAVAAAAHLHDADRERGAPPPARPVRHHAAALRPAGAARPRAERHDARRAVAAHDGVERQHHRPGRPAGRAGPDSRAVPRRTTAACRSSA